MGSLRAHRNALTPHPEVDLDGQVDSSEAGADYIDAMRDFIDECVDYFAFPNGITIAAANGRQFKMLFGMCAEITRLARGVRMLAGAGLGLEGRILVRSALEYAVTAQYSYLRTDGIDRLAKSATTDQRNLFERLADWTGIQEYDILAASVTVSASPKGLPTVTQCMDALDPEQVFFQQAYAVLSQTTHVTSASLTQHFRIPDQRNREHMHLDHHSKEDRFERISVHALAVAVMSATWIIAHVADDAERLAILDARSDELKLPVRYDDGWPLTHRAHPE